MTTGLSKCNHCREEWETWQLIEYEAVPYNKKYCIYCIEAVRKCINTLNQFSETIRTIDKLLKNMFHMKCPDELEKLNEVRNGIVNYSKEINILHDSFQCDSPILLKYEQLSIMMGEREIHITHIPDERLDNPMRCVKGDYAPPYGLKVWSSEQCR